MAPSVAEKSDLQKTTRSSNLKAHEQNDPDPVLLARGLVAYGTTPQPVGTGAYSAVEHTFVPSTLSVEEYESITGRCASILGNGSGFGVCNSCRSGALGATKK
jgi:hypothetical protein